MKQLFYLLTLFSSSAFSMPEEIFFVGDELYYNSYKISVHFDSGENLEDYASSGNGNISFFNVTWKEVDSEEIKTSDFYEEHILGFESYWNKESTFHKAVKQNSSLQGNNLIHMYQQRGHTCTFVTNDKKNQTMTQSNIFLVFINIRSPFFLDSFLQHGFRIFNLASFNLNIHRF